MNTDTGLIRQYNDDELKQLKALGEPVLEIDKSLMTQKQKDNMAVSLKDTRSPLGKILRAARSKYQPHVGAKQIAKAAKREAKVS